MAPDMNPPVAAPDFLTQAGWGDAEIRPLAGDASFRRYFRVVGHDRSAILMDAPPPHEDPRPFIDVARWLTDRSFAAPQILHQDLEQGLVLLEDFGDTRMRETVDAAPESELRLYEAAIDLLVQLRDHCAADFIPPYDAAQYHREARLLTEWYCPTIGVEADQQWYDEAWAAALAPVLQGHAPVTVLRDYHAENIMLIEGSDRLGLLDFQDALAGHPAYDLVSLLQDARRDVPVELETAMLDRYKRITGEGDAFDVAYHVLGAQRNAKIVGIFTRLWKRDGKPRYPSLCPRVWAYLERDLKHPALKPIAEWFDAHLPPHMRGDPMAIAGQ